MTGPRRAGQGSKDKCWRTRDQEFATRDGAAKASFHGPVTTLPEFWYEVGHRGQPIVGADAIDVGIDGLVERVELAGV